MIYRDINFFDNKFVVHLENGGQQEPHEGDGVIINVIFDIKNIVNFGERVMLPFPNSNNIISWSAFFHEKSSVYQFGLPAIENLEFNKTTRKIKFVGENYTEAMENAKQWVDKVINKVITSLEEREQKKKKFGVPPPSSL